MKKTSVNDILSGSLPIDSTVNICGWIKTKRDSKLGISFIIINDGSCFNSLQIVVKSNLPNYTTILRLTTGCSVSIIGKLIRSLGRKQLYEIQAEKIKVLGWVDNPSTYPLSAKEHSLEHLRMFAHIRPRTNFTGSVSRIRNKLFHSIHHFMEKRNFLWVSTPIITSFDTEGISRMFNVSTLDYSNLSCKQGNKISYNNDFFGKKSFLTVSGQLNAECYACALSKIYTFGPTFRAENSDTTRHLAEFWMLEPEIAFADLNDIAKLAEDILKYLFKIILEECTDDLHFFCKKLNKNVIQRLENFINNSFLQRVEYTEIIKILQKNNLNSWKNVIWGEDLSLVHERFLVEKYFKNPIIIINYPKSLKAFYMRVNDDNKTVAAMDLLMPEIGEIIGGSQREERLEKLDERIKEAGLNQKEYWWYRDLRKYGTVPHSGFGLGFERLVSYVTGVKNIRDVIPFPRSFKNFNF